MGPFTLSVPGYRLGVHSRRKGRHHDTTAQQDKEARSQSPSDVETQLLSSSRLPSESINPLSHSPDTLRQLTVAGLSPEDELPSRLHKGFPHKPLPIRSKNLRRRKGRDTRSQSSLYESDGGYTSNGGSETDNTVTSQPQQRTRKTEDTVDATQHSARIQHLNTMTAIMHRCLRDGDIVRAKRAFGLLVRTKDVDVRIDNLWAIGSEILMRDGEEEKEEEAAVNPKLGKPSLVSSREKARADPSVPSDSNTDLDTSFGETTDEEEVEIEDDDDTEDAKRNPPPPQRWGTAANAARVKVYLETLAQHHPYDAHRPGPASAVDFWPALFSIELYNLDAEFQEAAHQIYIKCGFPPSSPSSSPSSSRSVSPDGERMELDDDDYAMDMYGGNTTTSRGRRRRKAGRGEYGDNGEGVYDEDETSTTRHKALSSLRASTQRGALEITARMDGILENPPYSTHAELLRLRGHASLFIADLYLPPRVTERYQRHEQQVGGGSRTAQIGEGEEGMPGMQGMRGMISVREAERRLRRHVRTPEERVALARRGEEQGRARDFFRRAVVAKGWVEEWVVRFLDEEDEEEG
ncbi:hypothetical protein F5Y01DRAFT_7095 [Xylaria sp. FL0043]|nr:hypothetical protein F5Y01DRAFT_7095 [Xylaria sp. FL0043]